MTNEKMMEELFESIRLIARDELNHEMKTKTVVGNIIENILGTDTYRVAYQNIEVVASSLGAIYEAGDQVHVLLPNGELGSTKFILGKTDNRTPTITFNSEGLSDSILKQIQDIINSFNDLASDNIITPVEKQSLFPQWEQIKASYQEVLNLAKQYSEIDTSKLTSDFKNLESLMKVIFMDMNKNTKTDGETLRAALGNYLSTDSSVRLAIQAALRDEISFKATILSSNGESFKNGIINTTLQAIVMRGKKNISLEIPAENFIWSKLKGDGTKQPNWERTGRTIAITSEDIDVKQIFSVEIKVEGAIVAMDIVTIVDLNDVENIKLTLNSKLSRTQTYDPTTNNIIPDYSVTNQMIQAIVKKNGEDITSLAKIEWFYNDEKIVSDGRFQISNNSLLIKRNLTDKDNPDMVIRCKVSYFSSEYNLTLDDELSLDFTYVSNGEDGKNSFLVNLLHPYGNVIKNGEQQLLLVSLNGYYAEQDVTSLISNRKWFYQDDTVTSASPGYDKDGGVGWSLIKENNTMDGNISAYNTNLLAIGKDAINGSLSIKVVAYFQDYKGAVTTTLIDSTDPITGVILGNTQLKNGEPTSLQIEAYLGQMKIIDTSNYTFVWNLELIDNSSRIIGPMESFTTNTVWPKYGESIILEWGDIPENDNIYVTCKIYRNE